MLYGLVCERSTYTPFLQRLEQSISAQHLRLGCQSGLSVEASRSEAGFLDWMRTLECGFDTVVFGLLIKRIRVIDASPPSNAHPHIPSSRCTIGQLTLILLLVISRKGALDSWILVSFSRLYPPLRRIPLAFHSCCEPAGLSHPQELYQRVLPPFPPCTLKETEVIDFEITCSA